MIKLVYAQNELRRIKDVVEKKTLFGGEFKKHLGKKCFHTSYVSEKYPETYYDKGVIFETDEKPIKWIPFDDNGLRLGALSCRF